MAKRLVIAKGTPFLPLASARLPPKPVTGEKADNKFRALQTIYNGKPRQYTRRHEYSFDEIVAKFEKLYSEFPPVSPEIVEAHRRLGYPAHYITALETGNYKVMIRAPKLADGSEDHDAFEAYWGFDLTASHNIRKRRQWLRAASIVDKYAKNDVPIAIRPRLDWKKAAAGTKLVPNDFEALRSHADDAESAAVQPSPGLMEKLLREYEQADEDALADELADLYTEKQTEVAALRRNALLRWMDARGDLSPHDALDFTPKFRDLEMARQEVLTWYFRFLTPDIEASGGQEIPAWSDYCDAVTAQHSEWLRRDEKLAAGDSMTPDDLMQQRVSRIYGGKAEAGGAGAGGAAAGTPGAQKGAVTALELLFSKDKLELEFKAKALPAAGDMDLLTRSMMQFLVGGKDGWAEKYEAIRDQGKKAFKATMQEEAPAAEAAPAKAEAGGHH